MKLFAILLPAILLLGSCSLLVDFEDDKSLKEKLCDDGLDNDGDGFRDCEDQDCEEAPACTTVNNINNINNVVNNINNVSNPEICDNDIDDDLDGATDCDDLEDCESAQNCIMGNEVCDNQFDDDGDGAMDCDDDDCMGSPVCDFTPELDCGNGVDDDFNGMIDCVDPDCASSPLCMENFALCNSVANYEAGGNLYHYYRDIYEFAISADCDEEGQVCAIKPELSWVPRCYPEPDAGEVVSHYQSCAGGQPCGPGLVCGHSMKFGSLVCLPLCAPGHHPECIGGQGLCLNNIQNFQDGFSSLDMEVWTCDVPLCDPLRLLEGGCTNTEACYPDPSLFGAAACHSVYGEIPAGSPCPSGSDLDCAPGSICRNSVCRALCLLGSECIMNTQCIRDDPRQHFGFCR